MTNFNSFLDFEKEKVQTISLEQLANSYKENNVYGEPLAGIYHFALINQIMAEAEKRNLNVEVYDLFAAHNKERLSPGVSLLPQVESIHGAKAVQAHILRRVYANMRVTNFDDNEFTTNVALSFTQKGVQLGYGNMVKVCHNQCMLGGGERVSANFGSKDKKTIPQLIDKVGEWFDTLQSSVMAEREEIRRWQSIDIPGATLFQIIGQLTTLRVAKDSSNDLIHRSETYPLNASQINQFTELLMVHYATHQSMTLWDVYNCATELYKADSMDIPNIINQNVAMAEFLRNFV